MASSGTKQRSSQARRTRAQKSNNGNGRPAEKNQSSVRRSKAAAQPNGSSAGKKQSPVRRAKDTAKSDGAGKKQSPVRRAKGAAKPDAGSGESNGRGGSGKSKGRGGSGKSKGRGGSGKSKPLGGSLKSKALGSSLKSKAMRKLAGKAAKAMAAKSLRSAASAIRLATDRTGSVGRDAIEAGMSRRVPIQVSVDVAVPLKFAWDEWHDFGSIPEGVHRIEDVERDGDSLSGRLSGPRSADWEAEIIDEREEQSFAWRSVTGTDTAGLVTFHRLSDRLTRIELGLDVVPTNPAEALTMASHLAHRRAEADLRRFKAHVEFINPDVYESESGQNGSAG